MFKNIPLTVLAAALALMTSITVVGAVRYSRVSAELSETQLRLSTAETNLIVKQRALDQAREARVVLEAHLDRVTRSAEHWHRVAADLATTEGSNEDLNAYERAVLDRLRGQ